MDPLRLDATGRRLDLMIGIDELQTQAAGQAPPDGGLPGPHQPDKDKRPRQAQVARIGFVGFRRVISIVHQRWSLCR